MGQTVAGMLQKFQMLQPVGLIAEAAGKELEYAADLNRKQLFSEGVDSDGDNLRPYKSKAYAAKKYKANSLPGFGRADAYLSGDLFRRLRAVVQDHRAVIFSSDSPHAVFMEQRDGSKIFGLTDESQGQLAQRLTPHIIEDIRNKTGCQ